MKAIRVGVVGLGQIAQIMHLPYLHTIPEFEIKAVCDLSPTLVEQVGDLYHVPGRFTDAHAMIAQAEIDAVVISSTFDHAPITLDALDHGQHVLVEKPLCETPELARQIAVKSDRTGLKVLVATMKRYDPAFLHWQQRVRALEGVQLVRVHDFCHNNNRVVNDAYDLVTARDIPETVAHASRAQAEALYRQVLGADAPSHVISAYALMLGLGVHDMTILRGSFGDPRAVLFADIGAAGRPVVAVLDYGSFRCVWEIGSTDTKHFDEELAVWTRDEILSLRFPSPYLKNAPTTVTATRTVGEETTTSTTVASYSEAFYNELLHFRDCIIHDRRPVTDAWEGLRDIEWLLAIVQAAQRGHAPGV